MAAGLVIVLAVTALSSAVSALWLYFPAFWTGPQPLTGVILFYGIWSQMRAGPVFLMASLYAGAVAVGDPSGLVMTAGMSCYVLLRPWREVLILGGPAVEAALAAAIAIMFELFSSLLIGVFLPGSGAARLALLDLIPHLIWAVLLGPWMARWFRVIETRFARFRILSPRL
ncbi:MAG: hypothetical protein GMKNLPBB_02962 [Myxococcota bacterium]|nr:hypothetical protein [Myxococcota bacterium]